MTKRAPSQATSVKKTDSDNLKQIDGVSVESDVKMNWGVLEKWPRQTDYFGARLKIVGLSWPSLPLELVDSRCRQLY